MTKYRSVGRVVFLTALATCLICSPAWAAPNASFLMGWGEGLTTVLAGNDFVAIAAGAGHDLALRSAGSLAGWGANVDGQANVPPGNDFVAIAEGWFHSLALKSDGSLAGWGADSHSGGDSGQADVPAGNGFLFIAAGSHHDLTIRQVPEPAALALLAVGLPLLLWRNSRRLPTVFVASDNSLRHELRSN